METNLIAQQMVTEIERARLPKMAEHGRLIEEAMAARSSQSAHLALRGWFGHMLHRTAKSPIHGPQTAAVNLPS